MARNLVAPIGRVAVLVDVRESGGIAIPESARWRMTLGGCSDVFPGVVRSSGVEGLPEGAPVFVKSEAAFCLTVEHDDRDVPGLDVPEGHELRLYRATVKAKNGGTDQSDPVYSQIFLKED